MTPDGVQKKIYMGLKEDNQLLYHCTFINADVSLVRERVPAQSLLLASSQQVLPH
jgi:hypothetical protein